MQHAKTQIHTEYLFFHKKGNYPESFDSRALQVKTEFRKSGKCEKKID